MLDLFYLEGVHLCISSYESLCVLGEFLLVGYEVWPVSLGQGSLVSGSNDVLELEWAVL